MQSRMEVRKATSFCASARSGKDRYGPKDNKVEIVESAVTEGPRLSVEILIHVLFCSIRIEPFKSAAIATRPRKRLRNPRALLRCSGFKKIVQRERHCERLPAGPLMPFGISPLEHRRLIQVQFACDSTKQIA